MTQHLAAIYALAASALAEGEAKPASGGIEGILIMLVPIVFVFWWLSRSQKKREQERKKMLESVKKGEKVVTIGGIHGEVVRANEHELVLLVDKSKGVELRFARSAVASIVSRKESDEATADSGGS